MFLLSDNLFHHHRSRLAVGVHRTVSPELCSVLPGLLTDTFFQQTNGCILLMILTEFDLSMTTKLFLQNYVLFFSNKGSEHSILSKEMESQVY